MTVPTALNVLSDLVHAVVVGGIIAVRYLWPVWLIIIALWLITRGIRYVMNFLGFATPARRPAKLPAKSRR